jgi:hypothetical protein
MSFFSDILAPVCDIMVNEIHQGIEDTEIKHDIQVLFLSVPDWVLYLLIKVQPSHNIYVISLSSFYVHRSVSVSTRRRKCRTVRLLLYTQSHLHTSALTDRSIQLIVLSYSYSTF